MRVLVVEDHPRLADLVAQGLRDAGHEADVANDGAAGLELAQNGEFDAIVLDLMMPKIDGMSVLHTLRQDGDSTPVLILTAKDGVGDRVNGLDHGADDYLVKPFAFDELLARLRAITRRRQGADTSIIEVADLEIDTGAKTVRRSGERITLSAREYAILECLAMRHGRIVTREALRESVYDIDDEPSSNVLDVYVGYLRKKIDRGRNQKLIHTRRGLGYVLSEES